MHPLSCDFVQLFVFTTCYRNCCIKLLSKYYVAVGYPFLKTLMQNYQEFCQSVMGLFTVLNVKLKPQHNGMTLQLCKLSKQNDETAEEWMGTLWNKVADCKYKENDRKLKQWIVKSINDEAMTSEIIKEMAFMLQV